MPEQRSYGDMAKQMLDLAIGGPIDMLSAGARAVSGDLLFPGQRTTRYRDYQQQLRDYQQGQQRQQLLQGLPRPLPGTDVTPVPATFAERYEGTR